MNKKIINLALPNIVSNITVPLLGMVDIALMGHLDSKIFIGAIALGGMIFNVIYMGFGFLRMGTSGFTAQAFGARDLKESVLTFTRALSVGLLAGCLLIILQKPIEMIGFAIIGGSPEVETLAKSYYRIRIFAAPATISLYAITGWFIGMQNAKFPMFIAITINLLNIGFNVLFAIGLDMKSDGVALGTVCAQYCGLILAMILFRLYYFKITKYWSYEEMIQWKAVKNFFNVNKDIFIRTLCLIVTLSFFTAKSASSGDTILAVNTILFQFFLLFSFFIDGFAYAAEALTGKYIGAKDPGNLKKVIRKLFLAGLIIAAPFTLLYLLGDDLILRLLTDQENVLEASMPYRFWVVIIPIVSFAAFLWDGIYIGATASTMMRNLMLLATALFYPLYYILFPLWGNHGLWFAFVVFLAGRGVLQSVFYKKAVLGKVEAGN